MNFSRFYSSIFICNSVSLFGTLNLKFGFSGSPFVELEILHFILLSVFWFVWDSLVLFSVSFHSALFKFLLNLFTVLSCQGKGGCRDLDQDLTSLQSFFGFGSSKYSQKLSFLSTWFRIVSSVSSFCASWCWNGGLWDFIIVLGYNESFLDYVEHLSRHTSRKLAATSLKTI